MTNDTELLNEIEKWVDRFREEFYGSDSEVMKQALATFYMGAITGILMKRKDSAD